VNQSGERKQVTVLFTDLTGYTSLNEILDPEDVNNIMNRIFGEISEVVIRYGGSIEKLLGDAAMVLFGIPKAHEDDPTRAVRTAVEIHKRVEALVPDLGIPEITLLQMHSGINTGLVVIGKSQYDTGSYSVTGDTVNVAARLQGRAGPGEILIGEATYGQTDSLYNFKALHPESLKGKAKPVSIYKVVSPKGGLDLNRRVRGMRADLVGRADELKQMEIALQTVRRGRGVVLSVCGDAGTGKSRLVEEFKKAQLRKDVQWYEGQSYPFAMHRPYSIFIDLLNRTFRIKEKDTPTIVRDRVEAGIKHLIGDKENVAPYVAELFSIHHTETDWVGPEIWQERLQIAIREILAALAEQSTTIICLEDLHWSDPSSLKLFQFIVSDFKYPLLLLCIHRPGIQLVDSKTRQQLGDRYSNITVKALSRSLTEEMTRSILKTDTIPEQLMRFIDQKVEGNPFFLEEVISSLIESGALTRDSHRWFLSRTIEEMSMPPTVQGVIAGRVDRLGHNTKAVLQEASVIGRTFPYEILKDISRTSGDIDNHLLVMQEHDLIKIDSRFQERVYIFKHALIQDVVYNGLLKSERKEIHQRVAEKMEDFYAGRLTEHVEKLAFHYHRGQSSRKAVDYLVRSGGKSLKRYSLEESHRYFEDAYRIFRNESLETSKNQRHLIAILNEWAFVYYYRGRYRELLQILNDHQDLANSLDKDDQFGMFNAWLGCALWHREKFKDAFGLLSSSLAIGESRGNDRIVGYSSCWLAWTCTELGLLDEALDHAERGRQIFESGSADSYILINSLAARGYALWHRGERRKTIESAEILLEFGRRHSDNRSNVMGYCCFGWSYLISGDVAAAAEYFHKAMDISTDPWYSVFPKLALSYGYISGNRLQEAEQLIDDILYFSRERGAEFAGTPAAFFKGVIMIAKGRLNDGFKITHDILRKWWEGGSRLRYVLCGQVLATIYANLTLSPKGLGAITAIKNIRAIFNALPFTGEKASYNFQALTEMTRDIGATGALGRAYLQWGHLLEGKGQIDRAGECYTEAARFFEECDAVDYLRQAKEALNTVAVKNGEKL
jgi:class 3 adenylate cyclase/tetratricopeptide (TPR) repeat protein